MASPEMLRNSMLEYLQRAVMLVSVDALQLAERADRRLTDASANVAMLCDALQRTLSHGLRAAATVMWISTAAPSLWAALSALAAPQMSAATRDAIDFIATDALDDEARAAAFLRWLLNERCFDQLCRCLCAAGDARLAKFYEPDALIRREDAQSILLTIAQALSGLEFRLCVSASDQRNAAAAAAQGVAAANHVPVRGSTVPRIDGSELAVSVSEDASFIKRRTTPVATPAVVPVPVEIPVEIPVEVPVVAAVRAPSPVPSPRPVPSPAPSPRPAPSPVASPPPAPAPVEAEEDVIVQLEEEPERAAVVEPAPAPAPEPAPEPEPEPEPEATSSQPQPQQQSAPQFRLKKNKANKGFVFEVKK